MPVNEALRVRVKEIEPFTADQIHWFGLESYYGHILSAAALFDVPVEFDQFPSLQRYDYIHLSPFDEPKLPEHQFTIRLQSHIKSASDDSTALHNKGADFMSDIDTIVNQDIESKQRVLELLKNGNEADRIPLFINGHGGYELGRWIVGSLDGNTLPYDILLANAPDILSTINPSMPSALKDRYSIIILHSCNPAHIPLRQDLVDYAGVPILYSKSDVGGIPNQSVPIFAIPQ